MSQSAFKMINSVLDIWKIVMQVIMFFGLWAAVFSVRKGKKDGSAAVLFILVNVGMILSILLEVENCFDGVVPVQMGGGLIPATTKQSTLPEIIKEHGIGLENVRDVAERYFGGVNIKVKGDVFHVTVMLQQEQKK